MESDCGCDLDAEDGEAEELDCAGAVFLGYCDDYPWGEGKGDDAGGVECRGRDMAIYSLVLFLGVYVCYAGYCGGW